MCNIIPILAVLLSTPCIASAAPEKTSSLDGTYFGETSYGTKFYYVIQQPKDGGFSWDTLWGFIPKTSISVKNWGETTQFEKLAGCTKSATVDSGQDGVKVRIGEDCTFDPDNSKHHWNEYFLSINSESNLRMEMHSYINGSFLRKSVRTFKRVGK